MKGNLRAEFLKPLIPVEFLKNSTFALRFPRNKLLKGCDAFTHPHVWVPVFMLPSLNVFKRILSLILIHFMPKGCVAPRTFHSQIK